MPANTRLLSAALLLLITSFGQAQPGSDDMLVSSIPSLDRVDATEKPKSFPSLNKIKSAIMPDSASEPIKEEKKPNAGPPDNADGRLLGLAAIQHVFPGFSNHSRMETVDRLAKHKLIMQQLKTLRDDPNLDASLQKDAGLCLWALSPL